MARETFPFTGTLEQKEKWMSQYYETIGMARETCKYGGHCASCMYACQRDSKGEWYEHVYCRLAPKEERK